MIFHDEPQGVEPAREIAAPWDRRRAALKGRILMGASIIIGEGEGYESFAAYADELGLSEATFSSVIEEVSSELWRRACRMPTLEQLRETQ